MRARRPCSWRALVSLAAVVVVGAGALSACGSNGSSRSGPAVQVKITAQGCDPVTLTLPPGPTTFHVTNDGAPSISEFEVLQGNKVVGEKENLTPGLDGTFSVNLQAGTYTLACPGGSEHPTGTLTVTSAASGSDPASSAAPTSGDAAGTTGGCVPGGSSEPPTSHVAATLADFRIDLATPTAPNGVVSIDGTNQGTHPHEIVVVRGVSADQLPRAADGSIDEDALPAGAAVGELEAFAPGHACSAAFDLTAGTYTLFCNVVGPEGAHANLGMITTLDVT